MSENYAFYFKTSDGYRGNEIRDVMSFGVAFRMNEVSKWEMTGAGLQPCPFAEGAEIIVYRGPEPFFSGYVTEIEDSYDSATRIYDWTAEGNDDFGRLAHRIIFPDASTADPEPDTEADYTGHLADILLTIVKENAVTGDAIPERVIPRLDVSTIPGIGEEQTLTASFDGMLEYILDRLQDNTLGIRGVWDGVTGRWDLQIFEPRDVSETVVFSVESGTLSAWTRELKAPDGNWLYVQGCEKTDNSGNPTGEILHVIVADTGSIGKWGRIEKYVDRSDIKQIIETNDQGQVISRESWDDVKERLRLAALDELTANSAHSGYRLTAAEVMRLKYRTHWDIGDTVSVRIGGEEFKAPILEVKVSYEGGVETIVPSVGEMQKGELETVFTSLGELKRQVQVLQRR